VDWLIEQMAKFPRPFICYTHFLPPHEPYAPRRDFAGIFKDKYTLEPKPENSFSQKQSIRYLNQACREYDEYLAYADSEFGRLYNQIQQKGLLENTYVIITSDHGELFERGIRGHVTSTLYEPVIHIPLLIAQPGQTQRQDVYTPTSCVDVLPTILQLAGQEIPSWSEGQALPLVSGTQSEGNRIVFALEAKQNSKFHPLSHATFALIEENFKLLHYRGYTQCEDYYELFDLSSDPEELVDLYISKPSTAKDLEDHLTKKIQQINEPIG